MVASGLQIGERVALADLCAARLVAVRDLFAQFCFAWLTGNGDLHAKNVSVVASPDGEWRISPAYDLPSTVPYGAYTTALRLQGPGPGAVPQGAAVFRRRHRPAQSQRAAASTIFSMPLPDSRRS